MAAKKKSTAPENMIEMDRLVLIIALVVLIVISGIIGFLLGVISSPLDYSANNPRAVITSRAS